ncbi:MAG TPA: carboxypeptidase-like regulatory domain-containing protein [Bryobacteraceae bacterium]|nr:carboxypeptidase-like regulatory domain-containing protein [Bryobacteraceae bacterium]
MSKFSTSILCLVLYCGMLSVFAQAPIGTITGTVTDATGAVVPSATITITNKATSAARTLTANAEGLYSAPALVPGDYEVRAEMQGFRTLVREAQVTAGSTTTVDMAMTLGTTREVVTVEAATAQVNYDSHTVAGVIARESIQDIPLNGRSSLQLAALEPGVTVNPGATSQFNAMFNVSILGSNGGATAGSGVGPLITMDGGVINDEVEGGTSMNFSQEVVQEFQIQSVNFDAATGIAAGGAVNIVTRSGSNDFHGSAYFYYRDHNMAAYPGLKRSAFNPNPFFARRNPGAWLGGPVIKDKFFFFFSYEHLNQTSVITEQNDIPSLQPLNSIWPSPLHYNWLTARFDYRLSDKHTFFARFSHDGNANFGPYAGTGSPSAWIHNSNWSDQSIIGLTSVLTPIVVNDLRVQYHYWENKGPNATAAECQLPCIGSGLPGIVTMVGSSTFTYGAGNEVNGPQFHQSRSYQLSDTLSWQKGTHRIRFGADYEQMHTAYTPWDVCDPACVGLYSPESTRAFVGAFPAGAFATLPTAIRTTADLLNVPVFNLPASLYSGVGLGNGSYPNYYEHDQGGVNHRIHPWVADTWKVKPNFTLNYGLGYDLETGLFSTFFKRPQYLSPILNGQTGGVPPGLGGTPPRYADFAPQFGFAWALGGSKKTVIRGGAGLYWETQPVWQQFRQDSSIGPLGDGRITLAASAFTNIFPGKYVLTTAGVKPINIGDPVPVNAVSNITFGEFIQIMNQEVPALQAKLFGNTPKSGPYSVSNIDVTKQGVEIYPSQFPLMHSYQTSIGVQQELGHNMVITADYARRIAVHQSLGELDLNRFARTADGLSPIIPRCATTPDFTVGDECSTGGITFWVPEGRSVYNGLLVKLDKRFSNRYQFTASYALQSLRSTAAGTALVDLDNYFASYGPVLPRHNLNVAGVVDIPWGFKLSVNSSIISSNPVNPIITGIDLNGSGNTNYPLFEAVPGLSYNCFNAGCGKSDLVKAVNAFNSTLAGTKALNGATIPKLTIPSDYGFGTPIFSQDFRITKELKFKERFTFMVFGEFFNAFNIANLTYSAAPILNSSAFGQPTGRVGQSSTFGSGGPRAIQVGGRFTF